MNGVWSNLGIWRDRENTGGRPWWLAAVRLLPRRMILCDIPGLVLPELCEGIIGKRREKKDSRG